MSDDDLTGVPSTATRSLAISALTYLRESCPCDAMILSIRSKLLFSLSCSFPVFPCSFFYSLCFDRAAYSGTTKARISCCICHIRQAQQYANTRFRCVPGTRSTLLPSYPICLTAASPFSHFVKRSYCITRMAYCKKVAVYSLFLHCAVGTQGCDCAQAAKKLPYSHPHGSF